nr:hypothetical protein RVX_0087 [Nitratidesulfovibrio sp. HK-II]
MSFLVHGSNLLPASGRCTPARATGNGPAYWASTREKSSP